MHIFIHNVKEAVRGTTAGLRFHIKAEAMIHFTS